MAQQMRGPSAGACTPARRNARPTMTETAECERKARKGARPQTNTVSAVVWADRVEDKRRSPDPPLGSAAVAYDGDSSTDVNPGAPPVDVTQPKLHDIARPKTEAGQ
jgi:hypothetical protein